MTAEVLIGHRGADHIAFSVSRRLYPDAHDFWDGNWVATDISMKAGGFTGRVAANLRTTEFKAFRTELEAISATLGGTAALDPLSRGYS